MDWQQQRESDLFICYEDGVTYRQTPDGVRVSGWGREAFVPMREYSEERLHQVAKSLESKGLVVK